jgi:hypothetical protein
VGHKEAFFVYALSFNIDIKNAWILTSASAQGYIGESQTKVA